MSADINKEVELEIGHVLFIDIVGYSRLSIDEQHAAVDQLTQSVRATEQFQKADAAGSLIKIASGDGMALVFYASPQAPVRCAIELSRALKNHPRLRLRMGIHSGPVSGVVDVADQANLTGAGLNLAHRVMSCGDAGHILLSRHAAEDLQEYEQWRLLLHELGEFEVKHGVRVSLVNLYNREFGNPAVPEKLKAARLAAAAQKKQVGFRWLVGAVLVLVAAGTAVSFFLFHYKRPPAVELAAPEKSIAVLPFENLSEEKGNGYFANGIQDEILTRLSKIADLKVISRTSTQRYKSAPANLREIAKQLGVAHILEGTVQKSGDAVRVNVQLIEAASDSNLWADTFDRKLTDIFSVESEVAKTIADQLRATLTGREEQLIATKPTNNAEAYDAYLRGLAYTLKTAFTPANSIAAQKYLKEAVRLDPNFALAWALLSSVNSIGYLGATLQPTVALREEARRAAETALSLQPNLGEGLMAQGYYHYACVKDYDGAIRYFEQASQLLPNNSSVPESLAYVTRRRGQWERSEAYFLEAERLDPRNVNLLTQHALSYIMLRRFTEALRKLDHVLNITPDDTGVLAIKATIAQAEGDLPRAAALLATLRSGTDDFSTLGTRIYQAILERNPTQIIPWVKEELAKTDSASGFQSAELRLWLGWAQKVAGDDAGAEENWRKARSELEAFVKEQPENWNLIEDLALTNASLGDKAAAMSLLERALAAVSIEKDAVDGPVPLEILARVTTLTGDFDRAVSTLERLLSIPSPSLPPLTPALLRLDPMFDPLHGDPRFQRLVGSPSPK